VLAHKPLSGEIADRIEKVMEVGRGDKDEKKIKFLEGVILNDNNDLVSAVAAHYLIEWNGSKDVDLSKSKKNLKSGGLVEAIYIVHESKKDDAKRSKAQKSTYWESLQKSENPFVRLESAKILLEHDEEKGISLLKKLDSENSVISPAAHRMLASRLKKKGLEGPKPRYLLHTVYGDFERFTAPSPKE
jgi:hypothetical protein